MLAIGFREANKIITKSTYPLQTLAYTDHDRLRNHPELDARPIDMTVHPQVSGWVHTAVRRMESS